MTLALYPYQEKAKAHILKHKRCALWIGCGLGKTAVTIEALNELPKPALVLAPKRVIDFTWPDEIEKWCSWANVVSITGTPDERSAKLKLPADIYLINFELVKWLINETDWVWPTVIIDESSRVKNNSSGIFKLLRSVAGKWERHVQLTGTPSPNGLMDLWSQFYLLDKGYRLGNTITAYRQRWFQRGYDGRTYDLLPYTEREVQERCADLCLSMATDDYLDLPPKIIDDIYIELPPTTRKHYIKLKKTLIAEIEGKDVTAITAAVLVNKLLQLTSGCVYDENGDIVKVNDTKLEAVDDILNSIGSEPVIIVYQFKHELLALRQRYLQGVEIRDHNHTVSDWNRGDIPILFIHPASAGHGLNLQDGGRHMIWTTPPWNLEHYLQTNARLYRNGQTKPVMIYRILASKTIDDRVVNVLSNKDSVQTALMDALK